MEAPRTIYTPGILPGLPLCHQNAALVGPVDEEPSYVLLPFFGSLAACGFPSPADDHIADLLDLNEHLIRNAPATYIVRASGESMTPAVCDGDLCVIDRSLAPRSGDIVLACFDGAFTLKRFVVRGGRKLLVPENDTFPILQMSGEEAVLVFGVLTFTVKSHRGHG